MAYESFIEHRFSNDNINLISTINQILEEYEAEGYDLTLRQLYYQLVSRDIIPNNEKSYKNTGVLVSDARLAGLIDWSMIKDRGRVEVANPHWDSPADVLDAAARSFRLDLWEDQPVRTVVMVEKQALEGVLIPVCRMMDVPFFANKGYSSSSALYEFGKTISKLWYGKRQKTHVIYLGDHDPSGIDMTRDVGERLAMFAHCSVKMQRLALNMDQVREFNPPENPAKVTDSRYASYRRNFGESSWELDAIEPRRLATLTEDAIRETLNIDLFLDKVRQQEEHKQALRDTAAQFRDQE